MLLVSSFVGITTLACGVILDTNLEQCVADGDCASRGFLESTCVQRVCVAPRSTAEAGAPPDPLIADPIWGCLGNVKWASEDFGKRLNSRQRFVRLLSEEPITGMSVRACGPFDPECTAAVTSSTTDADGYTNLSLNMGFQGFLDVKAPSTFPGMAPSLIYIVPPIAKDDPTDLVIPTALTPHLASFFELDLIVGQVDSRVDPALGHLLAIALDCQGNPATGVTLRASVRDKQTIGYYTETTGLPSPISVETSLRGEAGFINLPTGIVTLETTVNPRSKRGGRYTVLVKAAHITYLSMAPSP